MLPRKFQMTYYLSLPKRVYNFDCFQLANNQIVNKNIQSQSLIKLYSVINNWQVDLSLV